MIYRLSYIGDKRKTNDKAILIFDYLLFLIIHRLMQIALTNSSWMYDVLRECVTVCCTRANNLSFRCILTREINLLQVAAVAHVGDSDNFSHAAGRPAMP